MRKWNWVIISVLILTNFHGCVRTDNKSVIESFFEARKAGDISTAYEMLSKISKNSFSKEQFENYCFVFRVIEYKSGSIENGYYAVNYNYYDKKFNKATKELYTYYINQNVETIRIEDGKIVFPHPGFVLIRQLIEEKKIDEVGKMIDFMLSIDSKNPDVIKSASLMGFNTENDK